MRLRGFICVLSLMLVGAGANGAPGDQLVKFIASGGSGAEWFEGSIAVSGNTVVVGAQNHNHGVSRSGGAYVFDISDPANPVQMSMLVASDAATDDFFGVSVAVDGGTAIVGAYTDDDNGFNSGSAYVFDISDPSNPVQMSKLLANDGAEGDSFGRAVTLSRDVVIVGAISNDGVGINTGSAYVFDISDPANPTQVGKLVASDGATQDNFGLSVAISGGAVIVGAQQSDDNGIDSGSVYVFDISDPSNPVQMSKLLANDGAASDLFGGAVAVFGSTAVVGSAGNDDSGSNSGSAYVFDITDLANPVQMSKLLANDGVANDWLGVSVAVDGGTVIVGASGDDDNGSISGSAYVFDISDPSNPLQTNKLLASDGAAFDNFGNSVAVSGSMGIVGAYLESSQAGSAYIFEVIPSTPILAQQPQSILISEGGGIAVFSVAASGVGTLSYQWFHDDVMLNDSALILGATTPQLSLFVQGPEAIGEYHCEATNQAGVAVSDAAILGLRMCPGDANADALIDVNDISFVLFRLGDPCP